MAIQVRGGLKKDFDPNKLTNRELAIVLDTGEAYFCFSPGNVKRLATKEDLEEILNASPEALQALKQLIADLELNPSQITNILNNISSLQTNKLDKTGNSKDNIVSFDTNATETDILTGEKHSVLFGKIKKSISTFRNAIGVLSLLTTTNKGSLVNAINELNAIKFDKANIANNDVTTIAGLAWDARRGKAIRDDVNVLNNNLGDKFPDNAGAHNSIFRGKYLGSSVTAIQYANIQNGTFEDLYIGDYWTIGGVNWRISAFNYYRNTGDTNVPGNHIVIVPDQPLYSHVMNDTDTTEGGYTGSKMYTQGLAQAKTIINNAFSGHVVTFRAYLCNAVTNGEASAGAWVDSTVDLMNEIMVYGSVVNGAATYGLHNIGTEKSQLPLFALNPQSINTRYNYWLRDIASAAYFAYVDGYGNANRSSASYSRAVRPRFLIS